EENARRNLRQELWRIRKAIGPIFFHADDIVISLLASGDLWLDTSVLIKVAEDGATPDALIEALGLYPGELLPGFYDEWIDPERERLRAVFEELAAQLIEGLQTERRWDEVRAWAERWIALGRSPEPAYRALMLAYSALGDGSKVAATFDRCVAALR